MTHTHTSESTTVDLASKIKPLKNNILFQFLDETGGSKGKFTNRRTEAGIILPTLNSDQKSPRWGKVVAVGPDVAGVSVGEYIYIEALAWTYGVTFEDDKYWKTDDSRIIFVTDDPEETYKVSPV